MNYRELVDLGSRIAIINWSDDWDVHWEVRNRYSNLSHSIWYNNSQDNEADKKELEQLAQTVLHRAVNVEDVTFAACHINDINGGKITKWELDKINQRIKELDNRLDPGTMTLEEYMMDC